MSTLATTNLKNASSGSNNIVLNTDGTTTIAAPSNIIKSGTAVASTSGVAIDFTGLPSWVKRVTVMFDGVSLNGTSEPMIQLGTSGGVQTTGYNGTTAFTGSSIGAANFSAGFITFADAAAANLIYGTAVLSLLNTSGIWACSANFSLTSYTSIAAGTKSLSGTLDRLRITTVNGTDTFDAGSINILWEG